MQQAATSAAERGLKAESPVEVPPTGWREILIRVWYKTGTDNIGLLAAGVAFYVFLGLVPLLGAFVMTYGLIADPATVAQHMAAIIELVPAEAARLINEQLLSVTQAAASKKGFALILALLIAIYGATRASGAIIAALNVIYEQKETRSFIRVTLLSVAMILVAVLIGIVGLLAASVLAFVGSYLGGLGPIGTTAIKLLTWLVAAALTITGIAAMYRYGPDRRDAKWRWLSLGSVVATLIWVAATLGFGIYAANFGDYNATYGSLGAVVVLLLWLYISAYAILLGAELNAETERQTTVDSTVGPPKPMGQRGATVADVKPPRDPEAFRES